MRTKSKENRIKDDTVKLSKALMDTFLKYPNSGDLIGLYSFYRYTANWQITDQPKALDKYCQKGLGYGRMRFDAAKKILLELGLIQPIPRRDKSGTIKEWYVRVNHLWKDTANNNNGFVKEVRNNNDANKSNYSNGNVKEVQIQADELQQRFRTSTKTTLNALKTNIINAKGEADKDFHSSFSLEDKVEVNQFNHFWKIYPKKASKGPALTSWERLCKQKDRPTFGEIKNAIRKQEKTKQWQTPQFIPNAAKWLNNKHWLNDPSLMTGFVSKENTCPLLGRTFGIGFKPETYGCRECADNDPKLYKRCMLAHKS